MAQLKDLIVTGAARILGKVYASEFVGNLTGMASSATHSSTATYATNAGTSTYATNSGNASKSGTATYATSAGSANSATNASTASYATKAGSANSAASATNASTATYASSAGSAGSASKASSATSATYASTSTKAGTATYATSAGSAGSATNASTATYASSAGSAGNASKATSATSATYASTATKAGTATYSSSAGSAGSASKSTSVVDYGDTSKSINIGFSGTGATSASLQHVAGYIENGTKIKDVSKDVLKQWLGLGNAAFASSSSFAASNHSHSSVTSATYASTTTKAGTATYASSAGSANSATNASTATYASSAGSASKASSATSATYASTATKAGTASYATSVASHSHNTGTESTAGFTKLYTSRGTSTDGTMTRKAIHEALNSYLPLMGGGIVNGDIGILGDLMIESNYGVSNDINIVPVAGSTESLLTVKTYDIYGDGDSLVPVLQLGGNGRYIKRDGTGYSEYGISDKLSGRFAMYPAPIDDGIFCYATMGSAAEHDFYCYNSSYTLTQAAWLSSDGWRLQKGGFISNGADYAEYWEWADGNPNNEDRVGTFVTFVGTKIRLSQAGDPISKVAIISATPSVIGDNDSREWKHKYLTDVYGRYLYEEVLDADGRVCKNRIINPDYDESLEYVERKDRPEWDCVGTHGKLVVRDDGTCKVDEFCVPADGGIATASTTDEGFYVMERLDENHIRVLIR